MEPEKEALEAYHAEGVELPPEATPTAEPEETPAEPEAPAPEAETPEEEAAEEPDEPLQPEPQDAPKKRSIYHDLKDTRKDLKTEKELREQAERERDDLRARLEAVDTAATPAERQEAQDELEAFAKEINADPAAIKRMRDLFLKDLPKSEMPEELSSQLKEFQEWQKSNSAAMEQVEFEREFKATAPTLTKMFPNASAEETEAIKTKLQELAHTQAFHDKELDYIAFKNQDTLAALVSPKKRGLEPKGRGETPEPTSFNFDPNADISKMSAKDAEAWEKEYQKLTSTDQLHTDSEGRKIII